tara:strand:- start:109 stop:3330 length:3222 start_codon:yes stop_codon:yes gene_type:complete
MINKRIFGTPIADEVREILEARQSTTNEVDFGESIKLPNNIDFSSRTPFVRMWTSVKFIEAGEVAEILESIEPEDLDDEKLQQIKDTGVKSKYGEDYPRATIEPIYSMGVLIKYVIKANNKDREQVDYIRTIYEIGNHAYNESYGQTEANESIETLDNNDDAGLGSQFPPELGTNPLLKPKSGITSISSETQGAFGITKTTTVNFIVHNFYDFDRIYTKYFLVPGAQIFLDFGFSDLPNGLYPPELLIASAKESGGIQQFLYGEAKTGTKQGFITSNRGNVEVLQGIVTDYSATVQSNGSVNCSVTLTSKNSALLSFKSDNEMVTKIKEILTKGIVYLGLLGVVGRMVKPKKGGGEPEFKAESPAFNDLEQLTQTPNADSTAEDIETFNKNLLMLAAKRLSGAGGPEGDSIRTGVFVESVESDNIYVNWGLFEDLIINSQFGFGESVDEINNGQNFEVKLNSESAFTIWSPKYREKQYVLFQVPEDAPSLVYPDWWANSDPDGEKEGAEKGEGSYNYQQRNPKTKKRRIPQEDYQARGVSSADATAYDKTINGVGKLGRIPIRECFINVEVIIKAFEENDTIRKALKAILDELNEGSDGLFNWQIREGDTSAELTIFDSNYTILSENSQLENKGDVESPFFTFNVMSPNSIVKDYNLDFKLPSGNIGNMYAIQGMSHGDTIFTSDKDIQDSVNTANIEEDLLKIIYEPDLGNFRLNQLKEQANTEAYNVFDNTKNLVEGGVYKIKTPSGPELIKGTELTLSSSKAVTQKSDDQPEVTAEDINKQNDDKMRLLGRRVANNFTDYYKFKNTADVRDAIPNLLPYTLSLTTYGISSIQPGDTFKVDYLPKRYFDYTYLQTTKVSHEVGPGGWYTSLDTQFRLLPKQTEKTYNLKDKDNIRISPSVLNNLGLNEVLEADDGLFTWGNEFKVSQLVQFMTDAVILYDDNARYDYSISFQAVNKLTEDIEDSYGLLQQNTGTYTDESLSCQFMNLDERKKVLDAFDIDFSNNTVEALSATENGSILTQHSRALCAPIRIIPGDRYEMIIYGNTFGLLHKGNPFFQKQKEFFAKYTGKNY